MFLKREKIFLLSQQNKVNLESFFPLEIIEYLQEKKKLHQIESKVNINIFLGLMNYNYRLLFVLHMES